MAERVRSPNEAAKMGFFRKLAWLTLIDIIRSSDNLKELEVESLLLRIESSQLRWFRHLIKVPPGHIPLEVFSGHIQFVGEPGVDP